MNPQLRKMQKSAAKNWAIRHKAFESQLLALQWLDEKGFNPPIEFKQNIYYDTYNNVIVISFITGTELPLYKMNDEIQAKLRVVPTFDTDYPTIFNVPMLYIDELKISLTFSLNEKLLEGLLGDFCVIKKNKITNTYQTSNLEVTCFS